jgi:hypothetical protein
MVRQARTGDTVLVKSREMTGGVWWYPNTAVTGGRRGKDDRKQKKIGLVGLVQRHILRDRRSSFLPSFLGDKDKRIKQL